jgi:hypothetical protein
MVHLEILEPSLAMIVFPSLRGIAARNVPVTPEEFFQTGSESISKNLIEESSPPSQYLLAIRSFLETSGPTGYKLLHVRGEPDRANAVRMTIKWITKLLSSSDVPKTNSGIFTA